MTESPLRRFPAVRLAVLATVLAACLGAEAQGRGVINGDYIAAVVNQELVTAGEVERRIERARIEAGLTFADILAALARGEFKSS